MEGRLRVSTTELHELQERERRHAGKLEKARQNARFEEVRANQSAERGAAEVANVRMRMRTQENGACQQLEVIQSRLNAESTAALCDTRRVRSVAIKTEGADVRVARAGTRPGRCGDTQG